MYSLVSHTEDFRQAIIRAISTQRVIQVRLASGWRTLEPYQLGYWAGNEKDILLYGYCRDVIAGTSAPSRWQYFRLLDIKRVELTNYYFEPLIEYDERASIAELVTLIAIESRDKSPL